MPPVAKEETTAWGRAMFAVLEAHKERDEVPDGWYGLAKALEAQEGSTQTKESWLSTIKRIRNGTVPKETQAARIAEALGVKRSTLPPSSHRLSVQFLLEELERVEADVLWATKQIELLAQTAKLQLAPRPGHGPEQLDRRSGVAPRR